VRRSCVVMRMDERGETTSVLSCEARSTSSTPTGEFKVSQLAAPHL